MVRIGGLIFRPYPLCFLPLLAALGLAACESSPQIYSNPKHDTLKLSQAELREGGLAFLTPSTVTGQEEDKQTLAYVFASTLESERPDIRFVPLSRTISAVNRAGLADTYRRMYADYRDTGVFDAGMMQRVAQAAGVRYLGQLKLAKHGAELARPLRPARPVHPQHAVRQHARVLPGLGQPRRHHRLGGHRRGEHGDGHRQGAGR